MFLSFLISGQKSINNFYNYVKSPFPQDELPYVCESNAANSITPADFFRFGVNASVKQGCHYKHEFAFMSFPIII